MKIRLLLKTIRWIANHYTKFQLYNYRNGRYFGNFEYLEYYTSSKWPSIVVSSYEEYKNKDEIKKEYSHLVRSSMYAIIGCLRYKQYKSILCSEEKIIKKMLK